MVHFGAAADILSVVGPGRLRSITRDSRVVTVALRSSVRPIPNRRRRRPVVATSPGGSSAQAAERPTWWQRAGGTLTWPAQLNAWRPLSFRSISNSGAAPGAPSNYVGVALQE